MACTTMVSTLSGENFSLNLHEDEIDECPKFSCQDEPRKRMTETETHRRQILGVKTVQKRGELTPDTTP